jgi:hypothetical protein
VKVSCIILSVLVEKNQRMLFNKYGWLSDFIRFSELRFCPRDAAVAYFLALLIITLTLSNTANQNQLDRKAWRVQVITER